MPTFNGPPLFPAHPSLVQVLKYSSNKRVYRGRQKRSPWKLCFSWCCLATELPGRTRFVGWLRGPRSLAPRDTLREDGNIGHSASTTDAAAAIPKLIPTIQRNQILQAYFLIKNTQSNINERDLPLRQEVS